MRRMRFQKSIIRYVLVFSCISFLVTCLIFLKYAVEILQNPYDNSNNHIIPHSRTIHDDELTTSYIKLEEKPKKRLKELRNKFVVQKRFQNKIYPLRYAYYNEIIKSEDLLNLFGKKLQKNCFICEFPQYERSLQLRKEHNFISFVDVFLTTVDSDEKRKEPQTVLVFLFNIPPKWWKCKNGRKCQYGFMEEMEHVFSEIVFDDGASVVMPNCAVSDTYIHEYVKNVKCHFVREEEIPKKVFDECFTVRLYSLNKNVSSTPFWEMTTKPLHVRHCEFSASQEKYEVFLSNKKALNDIGKEPVVKKTQFKYDLEEQLSFKKSKHEEEYYDALSHMEIMVHKYTLSLCSMVSHTDTMFLIEWLEYHYMVGVEHVYLYIHLGFNNTKYNTTIFYMLDSYVSEGKLTFFLWNYSYPLYHREIKTIGWGFKVSDQRAAFTDCLHRFGYKSNWISFLDNDEFIVSTDKSKTIIDVIMKDYSQYTNLVILPLFFYQRNNTKSHFVIEQYPKFDERNQRYRKSIVKPSQCEIVGSHECLLQTGNKYLPVFTGKCEENWIEEKNCVTMNNKKIYIAHYFYMKYHEYNAIINIPSEDIGINANISKDFKPLKFNKNPIVQYLPELKKNVKLRKEKMPLVKFENFGYDKKSDFTLPKTLNDTNFALFNHKGKTIYFKIPGWSKRVIKIPKSPIDKKKLKKEMERRRRKERKKKRKRKKRTKPRTDVKSFKEKRMEEWKKAKSSRRPMHSKE